MIAAMVESVNKGRTRKGAEFVRADFSDSSGQFSAACFEEALVEPMLRWAKDGTCLLLTVELDSPSPEEPPRVTVRGARPLAEVTSATQMALTMDVDRPEALAELAMLFQDRGGNGEIVLRLRTGLDEEPHLRLGQNFRIDGDLAEQVAMVAGVSNVSLGPKRRNNGHLRLVA